MVEQSEINPKLVKIREIMKEHGVDCFVCLHSDAHNSEYLADCDERVAFISGFKGSNGTCVITHNDARMWTDGRYYLAAQRQLQAGWKMEKMEAGVTQWPDWIIENFPAGATVGFDYTQYPAANLEPRKKAFGDKNIQIKQVPNLVDKIWGSDRPARPKKNVSVLDIQFTGQDVLSKFKNVAAKLDGKVDSLLVTTLDDICWVTNLRGADIDYNPVFFAYLVITPKVPVEETQATLYVDVEKIASLKEYLQQNNIHVAPYEQIHNDLANLKTEKKRVGVHSKTCNADIFGVIEEVAVVLDNNVIQHIKACKNEVEQAGMRAANIRDCAAIMKYFSFLEQELKKPDHTMTEYSGARMIDNLRTHGQYHVQPSFDTISSIGPNGAVIHYKPDLETALKLNNEEIYLLDSGGQYLDGTVDITRTVHFGGKAPTDFQKEMYTRVLIGNLDLERLVWPSNSTISGADMDILARRSLWSVGLDYKHGTGHGVGSYLNVHEGPQGISRANNVKLQEGMCVSDEPGFYKDGEFGIRIENVILCKKHPTYADHYCWENLTVAPYCRELIDTKFLDPATIAYINQHHQKVLSLLTPLLQDDAPALAYVQR